MSKIRVAIVGVGNCASSLVQGVTHYADAEPTDTVGGLMHVQFGDYHVSDIEFVAAFDVDAAKVGLDLADAINASENNTIRIADVAPTGVAVQRGVTLDGLGKYYRETVEESARPPVDVVEALKDAEVDVVVSYLPVGSEEADRVYAQRAIDARLFEERGVTIDRTYQLNVGGNMDFKNMLERERLISKKISKTQAVTSNVGKEFEARDIHVGPSDYVGWLDDRKFAFVRLEGHNFGGAPVSLEYKLEVWDSPNSAGVVIDAIRAAKIGLDRGIGGPLLSPSSFFMKSPPEQRHDEDAMASTEDFIAGRVER